MSKELTAFIESLGEEIWDMVINFKKKLITLYKEYNNAD